jgi:uncharacterized protein (TIRG00374 family)
VLNRSSGEPRNRLRDPKVYLGIAVSLFFFWLAFRKIDPAETWRAMISANLWCVLGIAAIVVSMLFIRGHRWTLFLRPIKRVSGIQLGWSTCIGFALNNLLPARLGEVARSLSASRKTGVTFGAAFGTVVVERIYDTLSVLVLFALSLYVWDFSAPMAKLTMAIHDKFGVNLTQRGIAINFSILVGGLVTIIVLLKWQTERTLRVAGFFLKPLPEKWRAKFLGGLRNFIGGLTQTTNPLEIVWILVISFGLWIISIYTAYLGLLACGIPASLTDSFFVLMSFAIAVSIPASPGYFGTFEFLSATAIVLVSNVSWDKAMGAAIVLHLSNYVPQTALGLFALAREGLSLKEIEEIPPA